jgi:hypothetical protein
MVRALEIIILILLLLPLAYTFPWDLPPITSEWGQYLLSLGWLVILLLSAAGIMYGTNVRELVERMEASLANRIEKRLLAIGEELQSS